MLAAKELIEKQKAYFNKDGTKSIEFRKRQLKLLKKAVLECESEILEALNKDLNKSPFEAYITEIGMVLEELNFMLKNMEHLLRTRRVRTAITQFPSVSKIYQEPYGCVLIMSPWNYPFQLAILPLVGAIACGNCAIVKPSNDSPATSAVIKKIITRTFKEEYIAVLEGGREMNQSLLENKFDLIFFTGSVEVGKIVMEKAAKHLTPVVLELGGKSPCIVDRTADIKMAGKRIAWGKCLNSGQTCVAPDYLLVHKEVKDQLIHEMKRNIKKFYGNHPEENPEYPRIVNEKHFKRLNNLIQMGNVIYGGNSNKKTNQIAPTILDQVTWKDPIMQEEIFGPIIPIIEYDNLDQIITKIKAHAKPLALYLFTTSKQIERKVINRISYGGGCVNDVIIHLASSYMGFGGVGESGMGNYHGEASIKTFSHSKSVLKKSNKLDIPLRYAPYRNDLSLIKKIMR